MTRIKTFTRKEIIYWTTARGEEIDITDMEDEHIWNSINLLTNKINTFSSIKGYNAITQAIKEMTRDRGYLLKEMERRNREMITIPRGCR